MLRSAALTLYRASVLLISCAFSRLTALESLAFLSNFSSQRSILPIMASSIPLIACDVFVDVLIAEALRTCRVCRLGAAATPVASRRRRSVLTLL